MDGREWLDDYRHRLQDIRARAHRAQAALAGVEATVADGAVTVVAGPGGVVRRIVFSPASEALSRTQLAALTVEVVAQAQAEVARLATEAVEPLLGADAVRVAAS